MTCVNIKILITFSNLEQSHGINICEKDVPGQIVAPIAPRIAGRQRPYSFVFEMGY